MKHTHMPVKWLLMVTVYWFKDLCQEMDFDQHLSSASSSSFQCD